MPYASHRWGIIWIQTENEIISFKAWSSNQMSPGQSGVTLPYFHFFDTKFLQCSFQAKPLLGISNFYIKTLINYVFFIYTSSIYKPKFKIPWGYHALVLHDSLVVLGPRTTWNNNLEIGILNLGFVKVKNNFDANKDLKMMILYSYLVFFFIISHSSRLSPNMAGS